MQAAVLKEKKNAQPAAARSQHKQKKSLTSAAGWLEVGPPCRQPWVLPLGCKGEKERWQEEVRGLRNRHTRKKKMAPLMMKAGASKPQ
jgi:hypothetical protein